MSTHTINLYDSLTINFMSVIGLEVSISYYCDSTIGNFVNFIKDKLNYQYIDQIPKLSRKYDRYYQVDDVMFRNENFIDIYDWYNYKASPYRDEVLYKEDMHENEVTLFTVYRVLSSDIDITNNEILYLIQHPFITFDVTYKKTDYCTEFEGSPYALPIPKICFKWKYSRDWEEIDVLPEELVRYVSAYAIEHSLGTTYTCRDDEY